MVRALALATMPVLTHYLSPLAYGEAALVGTVVSLITVFALSGIDMGYVRHALTGQLGSSAAIEVFCWRWTLAGAGTVATLAGVLWWARADVFGLPASLAGFVTLGIIASALATLAQTRARLQGRYVRMSWAQLVTGCVSAAASLGIAIGWRQDAWSLLVAMVLGYILPPLLLGVPSWRRLASPSGLQRPERRRLLSTGLAGVITAPAYWALSNSDRWFLAVFHGTTTVGIYSLGVTVGTVGAVVSAAVTSAWLPELARAESASDDRSDGDKAGAVQLLAALLMIVAVAVVAAGGDVIRALADPRFHSAGVVVPFLAAGVLFYGCLQVGNSLLILAGKLHWAGFSWFVALLVSLLMNRWLVPAYGVWGAAVTQAASFLLVMVLVWVAALQFDPLRLPWLRLGAGFALSTAVAALMQTPWSPVAWHSLVLKLPMGLAFSAVCLWIMTPKTFAAGLRRLDCRYAR